MSNRTIKFKGKCISPEFKDKTACGSLLTFPDGTVETIRGTIEEPLEEVRLTFTSKKRIEIERLKLERKLISLCKQSKQDE